MHDTRLSIGFLLGSPDISGGTYVIYEHGVRLAGMGHEVVMLTRDRVSPDRHRWHPGADTLGWLTVDDAADTDFDIVIATWWQSAFILPKLRARHYVYFIQSIESRFFEAEDPRHHDRRDNSLWKQFCESTYTLNLPVITEANWIKDYLHERYNRSARLVHNGIRKDLYREDGAAVAPREHGRLRVLVEGPVDVAYKNVPEAVELCRRAGVDEVWLLTSSAIDRFDGVDRVFARLPIHETAPVYRSCDVLVKLSHIEGMFGPPLEMFHCGGTAVVYEVTGHDEYMVDGANSYVVPRGSGERVVACLRKLRREPAELARLKSGARETADAWPDWSSAAQRFAGALTEIRAEEPPTRSFVQGAVDRLIAGNIERFRLKALGRFTARELRQPGDGADDDLHNFIQVYYWAEADGLDSEAFRWAYYRSGEACRLTVRIPVTGLPFWIRFDPSTRIGLVSIDSISVYRETGEGALLEFKKNIDFDTLYASGGLVRIRWGEQPLYLSTGDDPQLLLPCLTDVQPGETLTVVIELEETGVAEFVHRLDAGAAADPTKPLDFLGRLRGLVR